MRQLEIVRQVLELRVKAQVSDQEGREGVKMRRGRYEEEEVGEEITSQP